MGIVPGGRGTQLLPGMIELAPATELVFPSEMVKAEQAFRLGMVNRAVSSERLQVENLER